MAYFVLVGRIDENVQKFGARGYFIARKGKTLVRKWGPVIAIGGLGGSFRWKGAPRIKIDKYRTEAAASRAYSSIKPRGTRRYSPLPSATRILRSRNT